MTEYNIFCYAEKYNDDDSFQQKRYRAFNKVVGGGRYREIVNLIKYDILKDLKLDLKDNKWKDEWRKVTKEQWGRILEIPEADKEVIESIIGFKLELKDDAIEEAMELLKSKGYKIVKN